MKYLIAFIMLIPAFAAEWNDPKLPMADSTKPVYQSVVPGLLGIGGIHRKVRIPSTADLEEQLELERKLAKQRQEEKDIALASRLIMWGIAAFLIGAIVHAMNSLPVLDRICEYVMALGAGTIILAILFRFIITNETAVLYFVAIPVSVAGGVAAILSRPGVKQWSMSKLLPKSVKKFMPKRKKDELEILTDALEHQLNQEENLCSGLDISANTHKV